MTHEVKYEKLEDGTYREVTVQHGETMEEHDVLNMMAGLLRRKDQLKEDMDEVALKIESLKPIYDNIMIEFAKTSDEILHFEPEDSPVDVIDKVRETLLNRAISKKRKLRDEARQAREAAVDQAIEAEK